MSQLQYNVLEKHVFFVFLNFWCVTEKQRKKRDFIFMFFGVIRQRTKLKKLKIQIKILIMFIQYTRYTILDKNYNTLFTIINILFEFPKTISILQYIILQYIAIYYRYTILFGGLGPDINININNNITLTYNLILNSW